MKDFPYTELQRKWIDDLKTTDAPQTTGYLHAVDGDTTIGYCCLGRFCSIVKAKGIVSKSKGSVKYGGESCYLPENLFRELKLRDSSGSFKTSFKVKGLIIYGLTDLNDKLQWSFKQIAEYIEANPENVFTNLEEKNRLLGKIRKGKSDEG